MSQADTGGTPQTVWRFDPTDVGLHESTRRRADPDGAAHLPTPFCLDVGRRLLLAEMTYSEWNLRRVEKVAFKRDRSVTRRLSIDINVHEDAPVFEDHDGRRFWLVPLSTMRRKTLVNLDLHDEEGLSLSLLGIRFAQRLDESVLMAAAAACGASAEVLEGTGLATFVEGLIAGERTVKSALAKAVDAHVKGTSRIDGDVGTLLDQPVFRDAVAFLRHHFSLYVMLDVTHGRHRILRMSFDELISWRYQKPTLKRDEAGGVVYRAGRSGDPRRGYAGWLAALGLRTTRVRFQVPSAEHAASYHFEVEAPLGVRIVHTTLLAGSPRADAGSHSLDEVRGHRPVVGLHAVEVPSGSLCRVQVDLKVPARGWFTTLVVSNWIVVAVLLWVAWSVVGSSKNLEYAQITNVIVLLVGVTAGAATYVTQHSGDGVVTRLVSGLRALGAVVIALPALQAGSLVFWAQTTGTASAGPVFVARSGFCVSLVVTLTLSWVWLLASVDERRDEDLSPWEMTDDHRTFEPRDLSQDYLDLVKELKFDTAAIGIASAEGWHEQYLTSAQQRRDAIALLRVPGRLPAATATAGPDGSGPLACPCAASADCARSHLRAPKTAQRSVPGQRSAHSYLRRST